MKEDTAFSEEPDFPSVPVIDMYCSKPYILESLLAGIACVDLSSYQTFRM